MILVLHNTPLSLTLIHFIDSHDNIRSNWTQCGWTRFGIERSLPQWVGHAGTAMSSFGQIEITYFHAALWQPTCRWPHFGIFNILSLSNWFPLLTFSFSFSHLTFCFISRNCMNWKSWVYPLTCLRRFENNRRWKIGSEEDCTCLVCGVRIPRTSLAYVHTATSSTRPHSTATWMFGGSLIM